MNYQAFNNGSLTMMYEAVRGGPLTQNAVFGWVWPAPQRRDLTLGRVFRPGAKSRPRPLSFLTNPRRLGPQSV
jgi:hypothetical protein